MGNGLPSDWSALVAEHSAAVEQYIAAAGRLPGHTWMRPLAQGKWTPAEVTSHVCEAYRILRAELAGEAGMRLLGSQLQRFILHHTILPRLLAGRPFPLGVRAPRETRPGRIEEDTVAAVATLRNLADLFTEELTARAGRGRIQLTHAYFGPMSPRQGIQLLTVHTRHHSRQLEAGST